MFAADDTIVAVATPPGRGAIGVVRLSGPRARDILHELVPGVAPAPRVARVARVVVVDAAGRETADDAVALLFAAPASYTGEDVAEISAHGNPLLLEGIVRAAMRAGARLARPGEFTLRAFLNGKRDLPQAEAVADLIEAATPAQARAAADQLHGTLTARIAAIDAELFDLLARLEASLDFPDEGYHFVDPATLAGALAGLIGRIDALLADAARGRMLREGATVVIAGRPNVGKSSLFNALLGADRAIVTDVPGTTRDLVAERVDIEGLAVTLVDTAGARVTVDPIEREGVARSVQARAASSLVIVVLDQSEAVTDDDRRVLEATREHPRLLVKNKSDRTDCCDVREFAEPILAVSAQTGDGVAVLRETIVRALTASESLRDTPAITNVRHVALLDDARTAIVRGRAAAEAAAPEEFIAADLQQARERLDEIVGKRTSEDVLRHIFERFCIGK
ncbi:MAG TPA: tRNA uridine-5-carboxymethylaminomethyl(34) synthesis GTPase MnmE [Vicinamibacterales bacterium]|nr:tRNA uridine-5-carboxymethylaminomethyl(34) synthesis GTPase MnmE [Vicinamibacterales bacterium]